MQFPQIGNNLPAWTDNSASVVRRIVCALFQKAIACQDGNLDQKLRAEVAAIICKGNQAYHMMLSEYGVSGIWEKLPPYFKKTQSKLKAETHPVYHFFGSNEVEFDKNAYTSFDKFRDTYRLYVNKCNLKRSQWSEDLYLVPFEEKGLTIEKVQEIEWPIGSGVMRQNFMIIRGLSIADDQPSIAPQNALIFHKNPSPTRNQDGGKFFKSATAVPKFQ